MIQISTKKIVYSLIITFFSIILFSQNVPPSITDPAELEATQQERQRVFDSIIDLHGKTEVQAYNIIKNFIKNSYLNNSKNIIIITGKGANSQGKLKLKTPLWLKSEEVSKYVVGFTNLPNNQGGEGALFVKLKNVNKYSQQK